MKRALWLLVVAILLIAPAVKAQEGPMTIRYCGQSFFLITTGGGLRIAIDPFSNIGHTMPTVEADVVLVTHEHGDHNNVGLIGGSPRVMRGLGAGAMDWNKVYERIQGQLIYSVAAFHDDAQGSSRGLDAMIS